MILLLVNWGSAGGRLWGVVILAVMLGYSSLFPVPTVAVAKTIPMVRWKPAATVARKSLLERCLPVHVVKPRESLAVIGKKYYVTIDSLVKVNQLQNENQLNIGLKLFIPPVNTNHRMLKRYQLTRGESLESLLAWLRLTPWELERFNPGLNLSRVGPNSKLIIPSYPTVTSRSRLTGIRLSCPVQGVLTSGFGMRWGRMHWGADLAAPLGTPVEAAASGKVVFSGWRGGYGILLIIAHGSCKTYYAHLSQVCVAMGDEVEQGQLIGKVGATGRAYGTHLHFELENVGRKVNPLQFMDLKLSPCY